MDRNTPLIVTINNSNMKKKIIEDAVAICDKVADAVNQRNNGRPHCRTYCPGEEALIEILN